MLFLYCSQRYYIFETVAKCNKTRNRETRTRSVSTSFKVECKSHPRTNSRVPWGAVELCCSEKISWARMVKILVRYWLRIRSMCVYV